MADILLDVGSWSKRLFCSSGWTLNAYQISFVYDKVGIGEDNISPTPFRLATPTYENDKF